MNTDKTELQNHNSFSAVEAIRHLDYVILLCEDVAKMKHFYHNILGFALYREQFDGNWIELRVGSVLLTLRPRDFVKLKGESHDGPWKKGSASVQLAFRVTPAQVDQCFRALRSHGIEIIDEPTDQPWNHRTLFFSDPENNLLEIYADI